MILGTVSLLLFPGLGGLEPGSLETGAAPTTSSAASNVAFQIYFRLSYHIAGTPLFDEKGKAEVGPADSIRNRVYKAFNDLNMLTLRLRRILG